MVHGFIPESAVLASIPLLSIIEKLPSYFLHANPSLPKAIPLTRLAWDFTQKKQSYRRFCQTMSERFLRLPIEERLRDTTVGSVRLAVAFLRSWFQHAIQDASPDACITVSSLASTISQWPAQWWTQDHAEIRELIDAMVRMLGEEQQQRHQQNKEIARLEDVVDELERVVRDYEWAHFSRASRASEEEPDFFPQSSDGTVVPSAPSSPAKILSACSISGDSAPLSAVSSPSHETYLSLPRLSSVTKTLQRRHCNTFSGITSVLCHVSRSLTPKKAQRARIPRPQRHVHQPRRQPERRPLTLLTFSIHPSGERVASPSRIRGDARETECTLSPPPKRLLLS